MAELNFGLLTPPGSQSIGNAFAQGMDQAAVARAQENQNALAQYTLGKAKREDELTNQLLGDLRNAKTPQEQAYAYARAGKPKEGSDLLTGIATRQNLEARTGASRALTATSEFDLTQKRTNKAIIDISNLPDSETALASIDRHLAAGDIDDAKATALKAKLGNQATFLSGRTEIIMGMLEAKDRLPYEKITTTTTNLGDVSREQQVDAFGRKIGVPTVTRIGVSPNTTVTLAQAQQHFDGLSAYQKQQLLAQGKQFDSDRGVIVDLKNGTFEPVYSYPSSTPAAPAAIPTAPSAAPAGTPITQPRAATLGTLPRVTTVQQTNNMEGATAIRRQELVNEQSALENARQKLASPAAANDPDIRRFYEERFKEATNNIDALNKELRNQPAQPSATQPAQRTVLGPKTETPRFDTNAGGFVYPPSAENPQGKFVPVSGLDGKPLNESQGNATAYGLRMKEAQAILDNLANPKTGSPTLRGAAVENIPLAGGAIGKILPSFLGGTSEQQQQVKQAKSNFITAVLRKESGAVISDSEFAREDEKYFPQFNDSQKVIKQKEDARNLAITAMKFQAGPGAKEIDKYVPSISREKTAPNLSEPPAGAVRVKAK